MSDIANIRFTEEYGSIHFSTYWHGSELGHVLALALERGRVRWDDPPYLARIIFSEMIKDEVLEPAGYGISISVCDGGDNIYKIDAIAQTVQHNDGSVLSFEQFIHAMSRETEVSS